MQIRVEEIKQELASNGGSRTLPEDADIILTVHAFNGKSAQITVKGFYRVWELHNLLSAAFKVPAELQVRVN